MEGPVYPEKLKAAGIGWAIPDEKDREVINTVIFDELVYGRFRAAARSRFVKIIAALAWGGCDAAVLGCTEIPLLIEEGAAPLPTLDSTRLLARAAVRRALEPPPANP
jgi:aspartate racemase